MRSIPLFGSVNSVGKTIVLNGHDYVVTGVLDRWQPTPMFYDLNDRAFAGAEQVFVPFTVAVQQGFPHGATCGGKAVGAGKDAMLRSECVWTELWVELPTASDVRRYQAFLRNYAEQQRLDGRFAWQARTRLRNVTQWLIYEQLVPNEVRILVAVAFSFLFVCMLNAMGLMLAKFMARSGSVAVRRALGAHRGAIFGQCLVEAGIVGVTGGAALREQRSHLVQRELLLDTVTQNSPVALILVDSHRKVVYANLAARGLLGEGSSLIGHDFDALLAGAPAGLRAAAAAGDDSLFKVDLQGDEETFHLSQRQFRLQGITHRLYLLKRLTRELSRQEVGTWKKLIRVLSHELNNSLAPIASLAHSGLELLRRRDLAGLSNVFATISERAESLHQFISSYAAFAKLPAPRPEWVSWETLIDELRREQPFSLADAPVDLPGWFDRPQLEQALINLLKNAHEAGGPSTEVELAVWEAGGEQHIEVRDRGPGMSETVLSQALLPFYSTKRQGTGLGLALAREIAEAHGGRISLANRTRGGLAVTLTLPLPERRGVERSDSATAS